MVVDRPLTRRCTWLAALVAGLVGPSAVATANPLDASPTRPVELALAAGPSFGFGAFPEHQVRGGLFVGIDATPRARHHLLVGAAYEYGHFALADVSWLSTSVLLEVKPTLALSRRVPLYLVPIVGGGIRVLGSPGCVLDECRRYGELQLVRLAFRVGAGAAYALGGGAKLFLEPTLDLIPVGPVGDVGGPSAVEIVNVLVGGALDF